jgi:hypothetical protein
MPQRVRVAGPPCHGSRLLCRRAGSGPLIDEVPIRGGVQARTDAGQRVEGGGAGHERVRAIFKDAWGQRLAQAEAMPGNVGRGVTKIDTQIEGLLDRIVDAANPSVITACESRIAKLKKETLVLAEKLQKDAKPAHTSENLFELALSFLTNSWKLWDSGQLSFKRTVLGLAFSEPIAYCRESGKSALTFEVFEGFQRGEKVLVHRKGFEPLTPRFVVLDLTFRSCCTELLIAT